VHTKFLLESEGEISLSTPRHKWKGNIKMDLRAIGWKAWTG
jgi:hypothetical protein